MIMPAVARRNRVFGGTLKLRDCTNAVVVLATRNHGDVVDGGGELLAGSCNVN